jgi:hypothetical protein
LRYDAGKNLPEFDEQEFENGKYEINEHVVFVFDYGHSILDAIQRWNEDTTEDTGCESSSETDVEEPSSPSIEKEEEEK